MSASATAWLLAWLGMMAIAVANGIVRDLAYARRLGELRAHQVSTVALLALFAAYFAGLARAWPLASAQEAWAVGAAWLAMTLAFELGLGRARGKGWRAMLRDYDILAGRLWVLVPAWVLVAPYLSYRLLR